MTLSDIVKSSLIELKVKLGFNPKKSIVVNNLTVRPWRREKWNVSDWRNATVMAESEGQQKSKLMNLYNDLMLDGYLSEALISTRVDEILNSEVKCFDENNQMIDDVNLLTEKMFFHTFLKEAMNSKFWGHSLMELYWPAPGETEGKTILVPRKHVKPRFGIVTKDEYAVDGIHYRDDPYWAKICVEVGGPEDLGILLKVAQYVIYKRGDFGDWVEYAEVFGMPFRWATYDNESNREILEKALFEAGSAGSLVAPKGTEIQFQSSAAGKNTSDIFSSLKDACNAEMAYTILRNTMSTMEATNSGYAQSKTQLTVQDRLHKADRRFILTLLNETLNPYLERIGYNTKGAQWKYVDEDNTPITERITIDVALKDIIAIDDDYWYNTYNIPRPAGGITPKKKDVTPKTN